MSLLSHRDRKTTRRHPRTKSPYLLPTLEGLEDRVVLSHAAAIQAPVAVPVQVQQAVQSPLNLNLSVSNLAATIDSTLTEINSDGNVVLHGTLSGNLNVGSQTVPLTNLPFELTLLPDQDNDGCTILQLHLNEIHLNVLGLTVDTSDICLTISDLPGTASPLDLGNLLCGSTGLNGLLGQITGLLNSTPAGDVTGLLGQVETRVQGILNDLLSNPDFLSGLNGALGGLVGGQQGNGGNPGNILHLELGQVQLNLLGLQVNLDSDCNPATNDQITVDVGTQPGSLVGNLLGSINHLLGVPGNATGGVLAHLRRLERILGSL